ncbi:fibronectin type III domain-containing protein, partial [Clostridium neonatale]
MIKRTKKLITLILTTTMLLTASIYSFAADNDGWTEASKTTAAANGDWDKWCKEWESIKNNPTQISLTPGKNESELNFAWYSKENDATPHLRFGKSINLTDSDEINVSHEDAVEGFISNKATVKNLQSGTNYYYSYEVDGKWLAPIKYETKNSSDGFSFIFVGDPQIGSSSENIATGSSE